MYACAFSVACGLIFSVFAKTFSARSADLAENVFAKTENINPQATEKAQAYIHLITAK